MGKIVLNIFLFTILVFMKPQVSLSQGYENSFFNLSLGAAGYNTVPDFIYSYDPAFGVSFNLYGKKKTLYYRVGAMYNESTWTNLQDIHVIRTYIGVGIHNSGNTFISANLNRFNTLNDQEDGDRYHSTGFNIEILYLLPIWPTADNVRFDARADIGWTFRHIYRGEYRDTLMSFIGVGIVYFFN